ncbi:MAG: endonuclease/exonuclease/phosphatase family protein [Balneolaceae bacterium]
MKLLIFGLFLCLLPFYSVSQHLSVMTYNIRYDSPDDGDNVWEIRKDKMINQLNFYEPDLFGIQEGMANQVDFLDENLAAYSYFGVGRDDGKRQGEFSAVFYKNTDFNLLEGHTFWLSPTPEEPSTGWDAALPRICTYGKFERKSDGTIFMFFNTHFDHIGKKARVESMKLILEQIKKLNPENVPVIFMGDLNVEPHEAPIMEMKKQLKDTREATEMVFGPDATFNNFQFDKGPQKRLDYIAVSEKIEVLKYAVLTDSYDQKYISDHFPVYSTLRLKN